MQSLSYGTVSVKEIAQIIKETTKEKQGNYKIIVGTDSQNRETTKVVTVIAVYNIGRGGFFFYDVHKTPKPIQNIRQKLMYETQMSIELADNLLNELELVSDNSFNYTDIDYCIHVDAGYNGETKALINELTSWVHACGYPCEIKPDSFTASSIADRLSK